MSSNYTREVSVCVGVFRIADHFCPVHVEGEKVELCGKASTDFKTAEVAALQFAEKNGLMETYEEGVLNFDPPLISVCATGNRWHPIILGADEFQLLSPEEGQRSDSEQEAIAAAKQIAWDNKYDFILKLGNKLFPQLNRQ